MEEHRKGLDKHCRVCGKPLHRFKCKRKCSDYGDLLRQAYNIECLDDNPNIHPSQFCPPCFQRAGRICDAKAKEVWYESSISPFSWTVHAENSCTICEMFNQQSVGGRPRKERKNRGHPGSSSTRTLWKHLDTIAPASFQVVEPLTPSRFQAIGPNISLVDFQCPCCANILNRPIQLSSCGKMACADCLVACMQGGSDVCPGCRNHHEFGVKNVPSPPEFVVKLIGGCMSGVRPLLASNMYNCRTSPITWHQVASNSTNFHPTQQLDNYCHKVHILQPQQSRGGSPPVWLNECWLSHQKGT